MPTARAPWIYRQLAHNLADRTAGGADHHGFAGLDLGDVLEPFVGRVAGHAENAQRR